MTEPKLHVLVVWQPLTTDPVTLSEGVKALRECLFGYSWVKPMKKTWLYVVQVDDESDADSLREALVETCRERKGQFHLLASPTHTGGGYHGWLPKDTWPKIRDRTGRAAHR